MHTSSVGSIGDKVGCPRPNRRRRRLRVDDDVHARIAGGHDRLVAAWATQVRRARIVLRDRQERGYAGRALSGHTYTFTRQPNDTTDIDVVVVRDGKNLKGRLLGFVLGTIGRRVWKERLTTP